MNLQEASKHITNELVKIYSQREAKNICNLLLEEITTLSSTERIINKELQLTDAQFTLIENKISPTTSIICCKVSPNFRTTASDSFITGRSSLL